jgi:hypothetical protein
MMMKPGIDILLWKFAAWGHPPPGYQRMIDDLERVALFSNNWGVRKSWLSSNFSREQIKEFLSDHGAAQRHLLHAHGLTEDPLHGPRGAFKMSLQRIPSVLFVDGHFGLQILHPASLTQFFFGVLWGTRLEDLDIVTEVPLPAAFDWARPAAEAYRALVARLSAAKAAMSAPTR